MRFDTNFAVENKKKLPGSYTIYAFCFTHNNKEGSYIYVLGNFNELTLETIDKASKSFLTIKRFPYGDTKNNEESNYGEVNKSDIEVFEHVQEHYLIGYSYVIVLSPDDSKLVATSYEGADDSMSDLYINVYDTKEKTLLYYYTTRGFAISSVIFDSYSQFMFVAFYKNNVTSFDLKKNNNDNKE